MDLVCEVLGHSGRVLRYILPHKTTPHISVAIYLHTFHIDTFRPLLPSPSTSKKKNCNRSENSMLSDG